LSALTSYIVGTHHVFTRDELSRLDALLAKVRSVHGQNHPELFRQEAISEIASPWKIGSNRITFEPATRIDRIQWCGSCLLMARSR
jgi:hypothetical protein